MISFPEDQGQKVEVFCFLDQDMFGPSRNIKIIEYIRVSDSYIFQNMNRVLKLLKTPQIEQRTPDWYRARYNCLTASSIASALEAKKDG